MFCRFSLFLRTTLLGLSTKWVRMSLFVNRWCPRKLFCRQFPHEGLVGQKARNSDSLRFWICGCEIFFPWVSGAHSVRWILGSRRVYRYRGIEKHPVWDGMGWDGGLSTGWCLQRGCWQERAVSLCIPYGRNLYSFDKTVQHARRQHANSFTFVSILWQPVDSTRFSATPRDRW